MSEKPGAWGSGQVSGPRTEWRTTMPPAHDHEPAPGTVWDANNLWHTTAEIAAGKGRYPLRAVCRTCEQKITRDKDQDWKLT